MFRRTQGGWGGWRLCCTLFPLMLSKETRIILLKGRGESVFGHAVLTVACVWVLSWCAVDEDYKKTISSHFIFKAVSIKGHLNNIYLLWGACDLKFMDKFHLKCQCDHFLNCPMKYIRKSSSQKWLLNEFFLFSLLIKANWARQNTQIKKMHALKQLIISCEVLLLKWIYFVLKIF